MKFEVIVVDDDKNINPIETFECDGWDSATEFIKHYNELKKGDGIKYYYRAIHRSGVIYSDGTHNTIESPNVFHMIGYCSSEFFFRRLMLKFKVQYREIASTIKKDGSSDELIEKKRKILRRIAILRKVSGNRIVKATVSKLDDLWDEITYWCWSRWNSKFKEFKHKVRRVVYFIKNGHDIEESWSLDNHMLEDLKWNLNRLMKESYGVSTIFTEEAYERLNPGKEWDGSTSSQTDELSRKLMNETYSNIINLIDLYWFFNFDSDEEVHLENGDLAKAFIIDGTYDCIDYKKMHEESKVYWNRIWDMVRKYGQGMWDD